MSHDQDQRRDLRQRLTTASITGLLAGATRAIIDWLLRHLTGTG